MSPGDPDEVKVVSPVRVLISYAHGDAEHEELVRRFWTFLRAEGIDAVLDVVAANRRQFWPQWMSEQIRDAQFVLVIASPLYKERAQGTGHASVGHGVRWEARQLQELLYADFQDGLRRVLPVVLPGGQTEHVPDWLFPVGATTFRVTKFTSDGADALLRVLTGQPREVEPPLGRVRARPPRAVAELDRRPVSLRSQVLITAEVTDGVLTSEVRLADTPICEQRVALAPEVEAVWRQMPSSPGLAGQRQVRVGRLLARAMFDEPAHRLVADLVARLRPGDWVDVVLLAAGDALGLPIELLRLSSADGHDLGPLALWAGVTVRRQLIGAPQPVSTTLAAPLKVLAAVAAPEESRTANPPLDTEAEMQAVLDAVSDLAGEPGGQVRILEVACLSQIAQALREDSYHVLHLSAHGAPTTVELEDEDGQPQPVTCDDLINVLRDAGTPVPLIVLSSCPGAAANGMAAGLVHAGANRVLAMQTSVTDTYATTLVSGLYRELAHVPAQPVASALARARRQTEQQLNTLNTPRRPEFAVATMISAGNDEALIDPGQPIRPLIITPVVPSGNSVRELPLGRLIGRRQQLRSATAVLRRTPTARDEHGAIAGVQLLGIGGIGKTALAGRVIGRCRSDGMFIAVHEGRWNPTAFFTAVAAAITTVNSLASVADDLAGDAPDSLKIDHVQRLLATVPLLLVFDDFEQNLTPGGAAFADPAFDDLLTQWCDAADTGAVLITCRYPLPDDDRYLVRVPVPPLSPAELRRVFLRMPALRELPVEDQRLLTRVIGGHPRLIEYVDALIRGKPTQLKSVQAKMRVLARDNNIDLRVPRPLDAAIEDSMVLGSADILLNELLSLLSEHERTILDQLSVSRAPMTIDDLAHTLTTQPNDPPPDPPQLRVEIERLTDLTLLIPGTDILMNPWTAEVLRRQTPGDQSDLHTRALATRLRRFEHHTAGYLDLLDIARHFAALQRYSELRSLAQQAERLLDGSLAYSAFLAEIRPYAPTSEPVSFSIAKMEYEAVRTSGTLAAANTLLQRMHQQCRQLESDPFWARNLSVVLIDLGDLAASTGNLTTAKQHYSTALVGGAESARLNPDDLRWQNRLAVTNDRLGNVARAAGDLNTADKHYHAGLATCEALAATDPTNTQWQHDLSISRERLRQLDSSS